MLWFSSKKPKEIWEEDIQWPIGDIEAAERIRNICRSAADSAESVGQLADRVGQEKARERGKQQRAADRYQAAARGAMEAAMKISDDLMRDSAVREIVDLCLKANDMKTAQILFRAIQAASIREIVLRDHPALQS